MHGHAELAALEEEETVSFLALPEKKLRGKFLDVAFDELAQRSFESFIRLHSEDAHGSSLIPQR
jgi:hypothetical protein